MIKQKVMDPKAMFNGKLDKAELIHILGGLMNDGETMFRGFDATCEGGCKKACKEGCKSTAK